MASSLIVVLVFGAGIPPSRGYHAVNLGMGKRDVVTSCRTTNLFHA
jgi:hypothetical protein